MAEMYKIDEVAKEAGLTKRTIRYYEEIGLIPAPQRSEGGIRLYSREHITRLQRLVDARDLLGYSLQELQYFAAIMEDLDHHKQGYRQLSNDEEKKLKLLELEPVVKNQLDVIAMKLEKMVQLHDEVEQFYTRVQYAIQRFAAEEKREKEQTD